MNLWAQKTKKLSAEAKGPMQPPGAKTTVKTDGTMTHRTKVIATSRGLCNTKMVMSFSTIYGDF
jgi:hypothetical protein